MYNGPVAMVYSRDDGKLKEFLRRENVLDWENKISFMGIRKKDDEPTIMDRCDELNGVAGQTPGARLCLESYHYIIFDDLNEAAYEYDELPAGLALGELKPRHAKQLAKHEKYGVGPDFKNNEKFFQYLLSNGFPSVALLDKDDYPVAHMIQRPENSLGAGYVHPDYRSQGLYKVVMIELIKKIRDNDEKHCWANVAVDNEHSTNALRKLGGHVYEGELFTTFEYHPKELAPEAMKS
ncbi:hypothetical protein RvY_04154 [Ramazzottius varieornatus]|uniref:Glycine N-acyltransferase-like protein n=1 Tax=Ramazzottius varieornatus TaxID=947166 RepID=A0A1D1UWA2_RAMVA|nr:hypothetical protein RvY_04154 [Ramazzottius varieornatus]